MECQHTEVPRRGGQCGWHRVGEDTGQGQRDAGTPGKPRGRGGSLCPLRSTSPLSKAWSPRRILRRSKEGDSENKVGTSLGV